MGINKELWPSHREKKDKLAETVSKKANIGLSLADDYIKYVQRTKENHGQRTKGNQEKMMYGQNKSKEI